MLHDSRAIPARRRLLLAAALASGLLIPAALVGCGEEGSEHRERSSQGASLPHRAKWLELSNPLSPAQWLVSRKHDQPKPINDAEVQRVAEQLATAHGLYRESERMIANRSAQVSDMLASLGISESPTAILDDLTSIAGEVGQTEGFGSVSQHYFNLRVANIERGEALATLKTRYGPRR